MQKTTSYPFALTSDQYAWLVLAVVYLASIAAPFNQFKVPPILPTLMEQFSVNLSQGGWLMSSVALTGLILALPAGLIIQRLGSRLSGLIALGCLAGGAVLGALSPTFGVLAFSRIIEGIGIGLMGVIAPATIAQWFPPQRQGAAMGIWATWVPVGSVLMYNLAPYFSSAYGWQIVWWGGAVFSLLTAALYAWIVRQPPQDKPTDTASASLSLRQALANRDIWLLGVAFACFNFILVSISTYYPTFLHKAYGYPLTRASFLSSITTLVVLISAPAAGWLSDRLNSRRLLIAFPFLVIGSLLFLPFKVKGIGIILLLGFQGLLVGAIPTATFAAAPEVMRKPQWAGLGLAVVLFGQYFGQLTGPLVFGELVVRFDWFLAGLMLIPASLLGFASALSVRIR
ncbi:MAG: MFS transporter [Anaerolineales bacterium]